MRSVTPLALDDFDHLQEVSGRLGGAMEPGQHERGAFLDEGRGLHRAGRSSHVYRSWTVGYTAIQESDSGVADRRRGDVLKVARG